MFRAEKKLVLIFGFMLTLLSVLFAHEIDANAQQIELEDFKKTCLKAFDAPNTIQPYALNLIYSTVRPYNSSSEPDREYCQKISAHLRLNLNPDETYDFSALSEANFITSIQITGGESFEKLNSEYQFINLAALKTLKNLKVLKFTRIELGGSLNSFLNNLSFVESITIEDSSADSISELSNLESLKSLTIINDEIDFWPQSFGSLPNLSYLNISNILSTQPLHKLEYLKDLSGLKILNLSSQGGIGDLQALAHTQSQLRAIFLNGLQNPLPNFEGSASKNSLRKLVLVNSNVTSVDMLAVFENLRELNLSSNKSLNSDLRFLAKFNKLTELYIDDSPIDSRYLSYVLNDLENLHFLRISNNSKNFSNSRINLNIKNLRYLNLQDNRLQTMPIVKDMNFLHELNVANNLISKMPAKDQFPTELQILKISNNLIKDASSLIEIPYVIVGSNPLLDPLLCPLNAKSIYLSRVCHELNGLEFVNNHASASSIQTDTIYFEFDRSLNIKNFSNKFYAYPSIFYDENSSPLMEGEIFELNSLLKELNLEVEKNISSFTYEDYFLSNYDIGTLDYHNGGYLLRGINPTKSIEITNRLAKLPYINSTYVQLKPAPSW